MYSQLGMVKQAEAVAYCCRFSALRWQYNCPMPKLAVSVDASIPHMESHLSLLHFSLERHLPYCTHLPVEELAGPRLLSRRCAL